MSGSLKDESQEDDLTGAFLISVGAPPNEHDSPRGMGSFAVLPQDCLDNLLFFLSLYDCLSLSCTSLTLMEEINRSELKRRRKRMKQTFAYTCLPEQGNYNLVKASESSDCPPENIFLLPTVRNRVEALCRTLPATYPARTMALQLATEMDRDDEQDLVPLDQEEEEGISQRFRLAFHVQQAFLGLHRYHALLLAQAIRSEPSPWNGVEQEGGRVLTVHLERYIGDVLCAYYLMGHSVSGIVEGGPTERAWMDQILAQASNHDSVSSYRAWIYLHSTLLRTAPFTWEQQRYLGMSFPTSSLASLLDVSQGSLLRPHLPFSCGPRNTNHSKRIKVWDALWSLETLRTTLHDFGRLGPTFRGRDFIQSQTVFPSSCIRVTREFVSMSPDAYSNVSNLSPFLQSWRSGEESVIAWLLFMQKEAGKARPMTVSPPLVTVKCTNREPDERIVAADDHIAI